MTQTPHDRYPGPYSFADTPQDRRIFFGRSPEIELLSQQIIAARLLVLFGKSGLGKTSLLQAGVFPRLRAEGVLPIPVRLATSAPLIALVADAARSVSEQFGIDYTPGEMASLWEFFKTAMFWRDDTLLVPVLVFDQFEEIFTLKEAGFREVFSREVGTVVSGNPPETFRARVKAGATEERLSDDPPKVKIVMSLREEYLGALEELSRNIPRLFQERFRLLPLAEVQAREAIEQPALLGTESLGAGEVSVFNTPPFEYEEATLREMVAFLKGRSEAIEPFQLQLLCQHLERKMPKALRPGVAHITVTPSDLGGRATMDAVLQQFYREAMAALPRGQRRRAQELCERGLLTMAGNRLLLQEDQIRGEYRVSEKTLSYLVDQRLLRREPRLESLFYELSHDTLAHSIVQIRRWRIPKTYRFAAVIGLVAVLALSGTGIWFVISVRAEKERAESSEKQALLALQETEKAKQEAVQNFEQATQMKERAESSEKQALLAQQEVIQNFRQATSIVDDFLTKLDEEKTRDIKGFEPVRKELGEIGLKHYREFTRQLRKELGEIGLKHYREFTRQLRKELGEIGLKHYREFTRQRGDDPSVRTWVWYKLGVSLSNLNRLDEAIATYHQQLEFKPDHEHAWNSLGNAFLGQGKEDEAIAAYRRQLEVKPDHADAWNNLGRVLFNQGKLDEAIAAFQQQVDVKPDHAGAWNNLGRALDKQGKPDEAIAAYRRQLEVKPDHADAWISLGFAFGMQGKHDEAIAAARKQVESTPDDTTAWNNLGASLGMQGKYDEAIAAFRKQVEITPDHPAAWGNLGGALFNQGKLDEAIAAFQQQVDVKPDHAGAWNNLGRALDKQGKPDEAIAAYRRQLEVKPDDAYASNNLSVVLARQGKYDEAIAAARRHLEVKPDDAYAWNNLGDALLDQGKVDEAIAAFQQQVDVKPDHAGAWNNLGRALDKQGKLDEAIAAFRRQLEVKPDDAYASNNLSRALDKQGKYDEAIAAARRHLEVKPDDVYAWNNLGRVLFNQGKLDEAIAAFQQQVDVKPDHADAWNNLGRALDKQGKPDEAIAAFRRQLEVKPDDAYASNNLSVVLARQGKYDEAIAAARRHLEVKPDDVYAWNNLGDALLDQGKLDEAIAAFQQQVDVKPDHADAWNNLGHALDKQGKPDEAIAAFRRHLEVKPDHAGAWANIGLILWRQGKNAEAATAFAQGLAVRPQNLSLLSSDAELALVEGDSDRLHRRVDVALPQVTPKDQLFVILPFLTWLANPAQGWAPLITAINTLEPGVKFTWNFSTTRPAITRLDVSTQQAAQHFIDFFEGRIDRPTLQAQLAAN